METSVGHPAHTAPLHVARKRDIEDQTALPKQALDRLTLLAPSTNLQ